MLKNIKSKIVIVVGILLIVIGIIYQIKTNNKNVETIDYENIIVESGEETKDSENIIEVEKEYIKIHIAGQVKNTGILELEQGARISDAIQKAGGITELASLDNVNLAYCLEDGQKLYIPSKEEKNIEYITEENGENIIEDTKTSSANKTVNLNKADEDALQQIPGIGPSMAQKIIRYRTENGEFKSIEDLKNVSGIGDKKFESMRDYICVK